jgi:hypothetical protein
MSGKRGPATPAPSASVSMERAVRLYRLVQLLGLGARTRAAILKKLRIDIRTFYRDLELLRDYRIEIGLVRRKYELALPVRDALSMLPFPDPGLTLGEAQQLARGRTRIHKKLRTLLRQIIA